MDIYTIIGIIVFAVVILVVIRLLYRIGSSISNLYHVLYRVLSQAEETEPEPRSLNGYEPTLLPLIRKDFPDFDPVLAKKEVREYIEKKLKHKKQLTVHKVVIAQYLSEGLQKTITYQAAVSFRTGKLNQKRYEVQSSYRLPQGEQAIAVNCPNCGATLGFGQVECAYCGSRVVNPMDQHWEIIGMKEG